MAYFGVLEKRAVAVGVAGVLAGAFIAWLSPVSEAATASDTSQVTAMVPDECAISRSDLVFENYSVTVGAAVDGTSSLGVTHSSGTGLPQEASLLFE